MNPRWSIEREKCAVMHLQSRKLQLVHHAITRYHRMLQKNEGKKLYLKKKLD